MEILSRLKDSFYRRQAKNTAVDFLAEGGYFIVTVGGKTVSTKGVDLEELGRQLNQGGLTTKKEEEFRAMREYKEQKLMALRELVQSNPGKPIAISVRDKDRVEVIAITGETKG